jgi:hypothetical protein
LGSEDHNVGWDEVFDNEVDAFFFVSRAAGVEFVFFRVDEVADTLEEFLGVLGDVLGVTAVGKSGRGVDLDVALGLGDAEGEVVVFHGFEAFVVATALEEEFAKDAGDAGADSEEEFGGLEDGGVVGGLDGGGAEGGEFGGVLEEVGFAAEECGVVVLLDEVVEGGEGPREPEVVAIKEGKVGAGGVLGTEIACGSGAFVFLAKGADGWGEGLEVIPGVISGAIVNNDDFVIGKGLGLDGGEGFFEEVKAIVSGDDDGEEGHGRILGIFGEGDLWRRGFIIV